MTSRTHIPRLPLSVCSLSSLRELDISTCRITNLPNRFGNLSSLQWLHMSQLARQLWQSELPAVPEHGLLHSDKQLARQLWPPE